MTNPRHGILGTRNYRTKKESAAFIYLRKAQLGEDLQTELPLRRWP
jgi:hypothetical protein